MDAITHIMRISWPLHEFWLLLCVKQETQFTLGIQLTQEEHSGAEFYEVQVSLM